MVCMWGGGGGGGGGGSGYGCHLVIHARAAAVLGRANVRVLQKVRDNAEINVWHLTRTALLLAGGTCMHHTIQQEHSRCLHYYITPGGTYLCVLRAWKSSSR